MSKMSLIIKSSENNSKVLMTWELDESETKNSEVYMKLISKIYKFFNRKYSNKVKDLECMLASSFTHDELSQFDLATMSGKSCITLIIHKQINGTTVSSIAVIMALSPAASDLIPQSRDAVFDLTQDDLSRIQDFPEWVQNIVKESKIYLQRVEHRNNDFGSPHD